MVVFVCLGSFVTDEAPLLCSQSIRLTAPACKNKSFPPTSP